MDLRKNFPVHQLTIFQNFDVDILIIIYIIENMKIEQFDSIEKYKEFLEKYLKKIDSVREYDIYLHYIDVFNRDFTNYQTNDAEKVLKEKVNLILNNGLLLNNNSYSSVRYTSINGTSKFITETKNPDLEQIINYDYNQTDKNKNRAVIMLAIPKFINYFGKKIEFSAFERVHDLFSKEFQENKKLKECYDFSKFDIDMRHTKFSLFDCTLKDCVPTTFILGAHYIKPSENTVTFIENDKFLANLNKEEIQDLSMNYQDKLQQLGLKKDASNALDLIVNKSKEDNHYYNQLLWEEI